MKILALLGAMALLAGCVTADPEPDPVATAKRLCWEAGMKPNDGEWWDRCVSKVYNTGNQPLIIEPTPQPDSTPERRSITCHTARDFPGSRILTSSTTTCD